MINQIIEALFQARTGEGGRLEGHNHSVAHDLIVNRVGVADFTTRDDILKNIVIPDSGFLQTLTNADMDHLSTVEQGIQGNLNQHRGLTKASPRHDQTHS